MAVFSKENHMVGLILKDIGQTGFLQHARTDNIKMGHYITITPVNIGHCEQCTEISIDLSGGRWYKLGSSTRIL